MILFAFFNGEPSAKPSLPKEWWAQLLLKLVPSSVSLSQPEGRKGHLQHRWDSLETPQSSGTSLVLGLPSFSCFSLQFTSSSFLAFQSEWSLTASPGASVFQDGLEPGKVWGYFIKILSLPSFFGGVACRDLEFLSYSGLENSGWLYPHNKAAFMLHTSSTHDDGFCLLCKDKLFLPLNFSSLSLS